MNLSNYDVDEKRGFLPSYNPLRKLPDKYKAWDECIKHLPKYLISGHVRKHLDLLPTLSIEELDDEPKLNRAMLLLSYFGHAYVWGENKAADTIPANIAKPWVAVSEKLGRPPVLSYASHALNNWYLEDNEKPIELGNIVRMHNFEGGFDEDWFVLIHIAIEGVAPPAIKAIINLQDHVKTSDPKSALASLTILSEQIDKIVKILKRMPENCDPYIYYHRVRRFIFGWMGNPVIPEGVYYDGVEKWNGKPQQFRGETGAQSSIIPCLDAGLGLEFDPNSPLYKHLIELRDYMPPLHRQLVIDLEKAEKQNSVRVFIKNNAKNYPKLIDLYNECLEGIYQFRLQHLNFAKAYINIQAERASSPVNVGTGGTPFIKYLGDHCDEVLKQKLTHVHQDELVQA